MKILLVTPFYSPVVSGSARLLTDIVDHLCLNGHRADVLTFGDPQDPASRAFDRIQNYSIFRIAPRTGGTRTGASSYFILRRLQELLRSDEYDLMLCGAAYPSAILAYMANKATHVPYAVYCHGEDATCVRGSRIKRMLLGRALSHAALVMTNSQFSRREVMALGVPGDSAIWAPPGIDIARFENASSAAAASLRARLGLADKKVVLTVARLAPRKGHDMVIRAMAPLCATIPGLHYVIVGSGSTETLTEIARLNGMAGRVTIIEHAPEQDLALLFNICDIYAMTSRWDPVAQEVEGFGIVYLEAAACGKPCVAGSAGGSSDAVVDKLTGFVVDPNSEEQIGQALHALLTDPDLARRMGEAGRLRVRAEFERKHRLDQIQETVLGGVSTSTPHNRKPSARNR